MENGTKVVASAVVGGVLILGGCCLFGAFLASKPESASGPTAATARAGSTASPDAGTGPSRIDTALAAIRSGAPVEHQICCVAATLERLAFDDRWRFADCAWAGKPSGSAEVEVAQRALSAAAVLSVALGNQVAPEREAMVRDAAVIVMDHPRALFTGGILDLSEADVAKQIADLNAVAALCPRCRRTRGHERLSWLEYWREHYPPTVANLQNYKFRYNDYKDAPVRMRVHVMPSEYYNCNFRSTSRWRAFTISDDGGPMAALGGISAYCENGDQSCEELYTAAIDAHGRNDDVEVDAILRYPRRNSVCEQEQTELVGWRRPE